MNIIIVGASGGIGSAMASELKSRKPEATISGTYFNHEPDIPDVDLYKVDLTDEESVADFAAKFDQVDWLINCAGLLHDGDTGPEKSARHIEATFVMDNFRRNTLPTMLLARYFQKALRKSDHGVFASISARVGSISDNGLGGWYSYRSSKAALNMFIKGLSIEWQRALPDCTVAALHPGTVDTSLSKPFQKRVPDDKLFSPETSADHLIKVIESLSPDNTGRFWAWDGTEIPW